MRMLLQKGNLTFWWLNIVETSKNTFQNVYHFWSDYNCFVFDLNIQCMHGVAIFVGYGFDLLYLNFLLICKHDCIVYKNSLTSLNII
jgi:hypothetical protein